MHGNPGGRAAEEDQGAGGRTCPPEAGDVEADARERGRRTPIEPRPVPLGVAAEDGGLAAEEEQRRLRGLTLLPALVESAAGEPGGEHLCRRRRWDRALGKAVPEHFAVDGAIGPYIRS